MTKWTARGVPVSAVVVVPDVFDAGTLANDESPTNTALMRGTDENNVSRELALLLII